MIVVTDAGPLRYLILCGAVEDLAALYGKLYIPAAVFHELSQDQTPEEVRNWLTTLPPWLQIMRTTPASLSGRRHLGEQEAIELAAELRADMLLMDDRAGRTLARTATTAKVIGTIGILYEISRTRSGKSAVTFAEFLSRLRQTNFYFSQSLETALKALLARLDVGRL